MSKKVVRRQQKNQSINQASPERASSKQPNHTQGNLSDQVSEWQREWTPYSHSSGQGDDAFPYG